jgi:hypothetical protein
MIRQHVQMGFMNLNASSSFPAEAVKESRCQRLLELSYLSNKDSRIADNRALPFELADNTTSYDAAAYVELLLLRFLTLYLSRPPRRFAGLFRPLCFLFPVLRSALPPVVFAGLRQALNNTLVCQIDFFSSRSFR